MTQKLVETPQKKNFIYLLVYNRAFTVPDYDSMINNEAVMAWCGVTSAFT
jgi:hypothetical protein